MTEQLGSASTRVVEWSCGQRGLREKRQGLRSVSIHIVTLCSRPMLSAIRSTCKVCRIVGDAICKNVIRDERLSVKLHNPPLEVGHVVRIKNLYCLHISFLYVKRAPLQE